MLKQKENAPDGFKAHERKGEKIEGGFIVARKGRWGKRLKISERPFEYPTFDAALKGKKRLEDMFPDSTFTILCEAKFVKELIQA